MMRKGSGGNLLRMLEFFLLLKNEVKNVQKKVEDSHIFAIGEDGVFMRDALLESIASIDSEMRNALYIDK